MVYSAVLEKVLTSIGAVTRVVPCHHDQINGLFSSPGKSANIDWSSYAGSTVPSVSQTRWWSREEFWEYLVQYLKYDGGDETA